MEKRIKDFEDYSITTEGKVISYKHKTPRVMKTWYQTGDRGVKKAGYENIKLCKNNVCYHFLIHRLVAEAFIPNPLNLPEVNHKNKNRQDNRVENLEWCDRIDNLYDSYSTMSPVRNYITCNLCKIDTGEIIGQFQSQQEAATYAAQNFKISASSLLKYGKTKGYCLVKIKCND